MKRLLLIALLLVGLFSNGQNQTIDSLKKIVQTSNSDTVKIKALYEWDGLIYVSDPLLDHELNLQIVEISTRNLENQSNLSKLENVFFNTHLSLSYNVLGINEDDKGNYPKALDYYYKSLSICEVQQDSGTIGGIYNNIGLIHEKLNNFKLANDFYQKSLILEQSTKDIEGVVTAYNNIGSVFLAQHTLDSALIYYKKALVLAKTESSEYQLASTLGNIGVAFEHLNNFDSSLYYYHSSLIVREKIDDWDGLSNVLSNIGLIHVQKKEPSKAISYCQRGYQKARKNKGTYRSMLNCNCLYQSYKQMQKADSALFYLELLDSLENHLSNDENTRIIAEKEIIYQYEKQQLLDSLKHANELQLSTEIFKKTQAEDRLHMTILLTSIVLLGLIGLIIYYKLSVAKKQKHEIENQHKIISEQKHEIEQSINYAKLIQEATLPILDHAKIFTDSFILYKPKDVVSGDFYWIEEDEKQKYFAVADCTGHGIPGAFISMIGTILLNEIYNAKNITSPELILNELNRLIQLTLDSEGKQLKDGMDISFCTLQKSDNILYYAGANNPVWIVSKNKTLEINELTTHPVLEKDDFYLFEKKADKQPVGKSYGEIKSFNLNKIQLNPGDLVYIFSDGFADQFGGPNGKKFKYKPFKDLLLSINQLKSEDKSRELNHVFDNWKGSLDQVDDICIIGIKI